MFLVCPNDKMKTHMANAVERLAGKELSWDNIAQQTVHLYQRIVREKGR